MGPAPLHPVQRLGLTGCLPSPFPSVARPSPPPRYGSRGLGRFAAGATSRADLEAGPGGGGAGGYLEHIFRYAARELYGVNVAQVQYTAGRNADFRETTLEVGGEVVLRFATAYGFRNIQNFVRKVKTGKGGYHFVEIMACPSGTRLWTRWMEGGRRRGKTCESTRRSSDPSHSPRHLVPTTVCQRA